MSGDPVEPPRPDDALLEAVLRIPVEDAREIRERTPWRKRPRRQHGPSADYGEH
ncbi:MAG TPA: hypothetical protein VFL65_07795 [Jatrophihabitans sp.]|nr:hypothetical protein [Jatrophihabitans sp.]